MFKRINVLCFFIILIMFLFASGCSTGTYTNTTEDEPSSIESSMTDISHIHNYEKTVVMPTCIEKGYTISTCKCGDSYNDNIVAPLGHNYETFVVKPTYTSEGYTQHTCQFCTDQYKDTYTQMPSNVTSSLAIKDYLLPLENFSRLRKYDPEFVMIHFISAVVSSRDDPYNPKLVRNIFSDYGISVHYIIDRNGQINCYIPEDLVAYHAGYGTWRNDPKYTNLLNNYAIGIEVMAIGSKNDMTQYMSASEYTNLNPEHIGFTDAQYDSLKALVKDICCRNNIPMDRQHIIGHEEYSPSKTDPGELFDWNRLLSGI